MSRTSTQLKGYTGANPFHEAQAKSYAEKKLVEEFYPISLYWSLFNEQHEILLGTRGSGKTVLLRMLSYSALRLSTNPEVVSLRNRFIGFYIPLHLEFMASLHGKEVSPEKRIQFFQFAFNCSAARAFVKELKNLVKDRFPKLGEQRLAEGKLIENLAKLWFPSACQNFVSLSDIELEVDRLFFQTHFWADGSLENPPIFSSALFTPLMPALRYSTQILGLDADSVSWMACVDEAEFLSEPFLRCINSFMRSEKKPVVLKMATLPFRHLTKQTLTPGVSVEENGNDFNYRVVDLGWDSNDYCRLTDHLCNIRLSKASIKSPEPALEAFLGKKGNDDWIDYYSAELPPEECKEDKVTENIVAVLSKARRERYEKLKNDPEQVRAQYYKRFLLVYYTRRMKKEHSSGARSVGWFAGAVVTRRVADGNPRRFIQLMRAYFEAARESELTAKAQHRVIEDFSESAYFAVEGLPEYGPMLKQIVDRLGELLAERVHGDEMINSGFNFEIASDLLKLPEFRRTIELGVAYSVIFVDEASSKSVLLERTDFRLAHFLAVKYWLPMRKGDGFVLSSRDTTGHLKLPKTPRTTAEAGKAANSLQMELVPNPLNEKDLPS